MEKKRAVEEVRGFIVTDNLIDAKLQVFSLKLNVDFFKKFA